MADRNRSNRTMLMTANRTTRWADEYNYKSRIEAVKTMIVRSFDRQIARSAIVSARIRDACSPPPPLRLLIPQSTPR